MWFSNCCLASFQFVINPVLIFLEPVTKHFSWGLKELENEGKNLTKFDLCMCEILSLVILLKNIVCAQLFQLFMTPWTVAHQAPLSMEFSVKEEWRRLPFLTPRDLPDPRIKPVSPALADGFFTTAAAVSLQSCPTLCDPTYGSPPGSPVPGILQARTLEWVAISFSNAWKWKVKMKSLSRVRLLATPWTAAYQGPPSMGFSRQEYWSGVPFTTSNTNLPF